MTKENISNKIEATVLGQKVSYPQSYDPTVLVAIPRKWNREIYNITPEFPFVGVDVWHAYELSFLTTKGLPVTGLLKLVIPSNSQYIVESKSLKLYLNSFNMSRYGNKATEGIEQVIDIIQQDLTKLLQVQVKLSFFQDTVETSSLFENFEVLENNASVESIEFLDFTENPSLLEETNDNTEVKWCTHLLRSNCKVTHQPDWGTLYIHIKGDLGISKESLLKYIVSLRNENHFHEEICEMVYKRVWDLILPSQLMVSCIYTRRGGIDICPIRSNTPELIPSLFTDEGQLFSKLLRQ